MSLESVREFLAERGYADRVLTFDISSATVELAARAVGVPEAPIAKTLSFGAAHGPRRRGRRLARQFEQVQACFRGKTNDARA